MNGTLGDAEKEAFKREGEALGDGRRRRRASAAAAAASDGGERRRPDFKS